MTEQDRIELLVRLDERTARLVDALPKIEKRLVDLETVRWVLHGAHIALSGVAAALGYKFAGHH